MTAWLLQDEFRAMRARFHRALGVSIGVHALLAGGLLAAAGARPQAQRIVEVTWLEPVAEPAAPPVDAPRLRQIPESPPAPEDPARGVAARPQARPAEAAAARERAAVDERRRAQLAELAATRGSVAGAAAVPPVSGVARDLLAGAPVARSDLARMASATMVPVAERGRPAALARGPEAGGTALALTRGPASGGGGLAVAAALPGLGAGVGNRDDGGHDSATRAAADPRVPGDAAGDVRLEGPAAGRQVLAQALPEYPDWARRQAVEAVVTLHFTVLPDGRVREDVRVERTGGFRDFDERAVAAFRQWRFAPLTGGDAAGQWGTITFRFRLRG